jgi:tRNA(Ile)-lysidine synthase
LLTETLPAGPITSAEFANALASLARFESCPFLAVAVSGGADSLALAILADRWARERCGSICAVTVDHRLRPESSAEVRRLRGWLSARAIRHEILVWSGDKPISRIQEAARVARYALLAEWCREHGCLHLLTAHHRKDQVETHLIRRRAGSGPDGLAGISAIRELADCRVLRPLLGVPKARLAALLDAEQQPFITDPSNSDPRFERSRLRGSGAVPADADFTALDRQIRTFGCERIVQERNRDALLAHALTLHPAGFAVLDPGLVLAASPEIAERALAAVAATIGGRIYPPRGRRVARLRERLAGARSRGHTLGGCRFVVWRERILVLREIAAAAAPVRLTPGDSLLWDGRFRVALPVAADGPIVIGHLGQAGVAKFKPLSPGSAGGTLPQLLHPILPAAWDKDGIVAIPQFEYLRDRAEAAPEIAFRPINPATRAGFTVV